MSDYENQKLQTDLPRVSLTTEQEMLMLVRARSRDKEIDEMEKRLDALPPLVGPPKPPRKYFGSICGTQRLRDISKLSGERLDKK